MNINTFEFNLFGVHTYVVWDPASREAAIIDPGMENPMEQETLDDFIDVNRLRPVHLINTHLHIDHTLGNDYVTDRYGLAVEAHPADDFLGKARREQAQMFHLRIPAPKPLDINVRLDEGDRITIGKDYLEVISVPGHSPGSIALYSPTDHFLIAGDILFRGSIGRTDLPGGDHRALIEGIRSKLMELPDDTIVYPGHGPTTTIGYERRGNPYL